MNKTVATWPNREEFVRFWSQQSDYSCSGVANRSTTGASDLGSTGADERGTTVTNDIFAEFDESLIGNQRITRARLQEFVKDTIFLNR